MDLIHIISCKLHPFLVLVLLDLDSNFRHIGFHRRQPLPALLDQSLLLDSKPRYYPLPGLVLWVLVLVADAGMVWDSMEMRRFAPLCLFCCVVVDACLLMDALRVGWHTRALTVEYSHCILLVLQFRVKERVYVHDKYTREDMLCLF